MIEDVVYLRRVEDLALFPWTVDTIRALNRAGLPVVVVTNQAAVARGLLTEERLHEIHRHLEQALNAGGAVVTAYYYCPHHPDGSVAAYTMTCDCRKPARGLADRAAQDLNLDLARSFVVGDTWLDVGLARAVGARGILVRTGSGARLESQPVPGLTADAIVDNLAGAGSWILQNLKS